ncbi:MAG TPA: M48 family metalloprotease [Trebonia sp.]|nr:M48 family metalloprotease [Trebonia sp.]
MHCYGLRAAVLGGVLCGLTLTAGFLLAGMAGLAVASAIVFAVGWVVYFQSERAVLTALRARPVSEVERPELYRLVRELCRDARLPVPRLFLSPTTQPNILTVGCSARSAAVCCTEGLLRVLALGELRAVLAHELAHVSRRDIAVSSWSAGLASLVAFCPLSALLLQLTASYGREYHADAEGALLAGDPMALASALRKIDMSTAALPLRPRGPLTASAHLMIAHPFSYCGFGRLFITHPPTGERVRRLEALAGYPRLLVAPALCRGARVPARRSGGCLPPGSRRPQTSLRYRPGAGGAPGARVPVATDLTSLPPRRRGVLRATLIT